MSIKNFASTLWNVFFLNSTLLCLRHWIAYWKREFFYYHKFSIIWTQQNLILGSIKIGQVHSFNIECVSKIFGRSSGWVWWIIGEQTLPIDGRIFWLTMIFDLTEINTCFCYSLSAVCFKSNFINYVNSPNPIHFELFSRNVCEESNRREQHVREYKTGPQLRKFARMCLIVID